MFHEPFIHSGVYSRDWAPVHSVANMELAVNAAATSAEDYSFSNPQCPKPSFVPLAITMDIPAERVYVSDSVGTPAREFILNEDDIVARLGHDFDLYFTNIFPIAYGIWTAEAVSRVYSPASKIIWRVKPFVDVSGRKIHVYGKFAVI